MHAKTALYRHFDASGVLLYVGITNHALRRLDQHSQRAHWFSSISDVRIEWLESRELALQAEAIAIAKENPLYNVRRPDGRIGHWEGRLGWYILHTSSGRKDGYYQRKPDALGVLSYLKETFPKEQFVLQEREEADRRIGDWEVLRHSNSHEWAFGLEPYDAR